MSEEVKINGEVYWGVKQVAEYLDVKHQNVDKQVGLPDPVVDIPRRRLWLRSDVQAFKRARDRKRARRQAKREQEEAA